MILKTKKILLMFFPNQVVFTFRIKADFEEVIVNVKFDTEWRKNRTNLLSSTPKRQSSKLHRKTCEIEGFEIGSVDVVTFA